MGNRLKELRIKKGVTQKELAEMLSLTPKAVSFYELGQRQIPNDTLAFLADYFGVTVDYLLGRSDEPKIKFDFQLFRDKSERDEVKKKLLDLYESMSEEDKKTAIAILEAIAAKGKK